MDWSLTHNCPGPSRPVCQPCCFTLLRVPRNARQAMVEPIHVDEHARDCHRAQPESAAEAQWHHHVVFPLHDGVLTPDAAGCPVPPWLCPLPVSLGDQHHSCISHPGCHLPWHPLLPPHCYCRVSLCKLSISDTRIPHPSISCLNHLSYWFHFLACL